MGLVAKNRVSSSSFGGSVRDTQASHRSGVLPVRALRIRAFTVAERFSAETAVVTGAPRAATFEANAGAKPGTRIAASHSPAERTNRTLALPSFTSTGASNARASFQLAASAAFTTMSARVLRAGPVRGHVMSMSEREK